jgi:protein-tyrosine phosphatase
MNRPILESYWIDPDRFLAGEYPGGFDDSEITRRRMTAFLEAGINTFFDLTQSHELVSYESILKKQAAIHGIEPAYYRFAVRDHHIPSHETMSVILDAIDDALNAGRNIYLHCWGGIGRTGTAVGCYLVRHGMTNEEALTQVGEWFRTMPKHIFFPTSPETDEQIQFVCNWRENRVAAHKITQNCPEG